jgi:hypothetical protein
VWQGARVGGARRPPWPPLETTSLAFFARIDVRRREQSHRCHLHQLTSTTPPSARPLALALPQTRIGRRGGGLAATRFIHRHRGCRRRLLCLRSQDDGAEEDDRGNRRGRHADNVTRGAGVSPPAQALRDADAASHGAIAAVSLHVLHVVLKLIVVCSSISPRPPRHPKFDCCVQFEPGGPSHFAHARRASSPRAASGSRWRSSCRRRGAASLASQRRSKARRLTRVVDNVGHRPRHCRKLSVVRCRIATASTAAATAPQDDPVGRLENSG